MTDTIRFCGLGGTDEVGASCALLEFPEARVLIDAGVRPRDLGDASLPILEVLKTHPPDMILVTHAHLDHVGALPVVHKRFPRVPIFATRATASLAIEVLFDAAKVASSQGAGLYSERAILSTVNAMQLIEPGVPIPNLPLEVTPIEAGHLLGAVSYLFRSSAGTVMHSGDINNVATLAAGGCQLPPSPHPRGRAHPREYVRRHHAALEKESGQSIRGSCAGGPRARWKGAHSDVRVGSCAGVDPDPAQPHHGWLVTSSAGVFGWLGARHDRTLRSHAQRFAGCVAQCLEQFRLATIPARSRAPRQRRR
ncbi:MAG: MBL fold metallo-hydrolase [Pleurocapsa sp. SU_196_0]|nr:MBL fold metallo-hydrolase [Pleurocapsa sp. SU_196_0]